MYENEQDNPLWDWDEEFDTEQVRPHVRKMRRNDPVNTHHDFQRRTENARNRQRKMKYGDD